MGAIFMTRPACILFDCMETVVDILNKPDIRLYCKWAYYGSGYETLWENFDSFVDSYQKVKNDLDSQHREHEEYNLFDRFKRMVEQVTVKTDETETIVSAISKNYWVNYKRNCFVHDSVKSALYNLSGKFRLGIVSNFMIDSGVEELLDIHGVSKFFDFIITSIKVGWKKPHEEIYRNALVLAKVTKREIIFVGDDYICDYEAPQKFGFDAVLLDKENKFKNVNKRIFSINDLFGLLG
jgi:putative hydrolase of the HAD superfamily